LEDVQMHEEPEVQQQQQQHQAQEEDQEEQQLPQVGATCAVSCVYLNRRR
jgi:hypothetical protein